MRVFIAIELNDYIKDYIYKKQQLVRENSKSGNFARRDNFHLTLRFIGEVNDEEIKNIEEAINNTANNKEKFSLRLGKIGYFSRGNKKIIWVGIGCGNEILQSLFDSLENNLELKGFNKERRGLSPHITMGREIKLTASFDNLIKTINGDDKEVEVNRITLMESIREDGILKYRPIYIKKLKDS